MDNMEARLIIVGLGILVVLVEWAKIYFDLDFFDA